MYILAAVFLLLSGAAALIYQVAWVRLLGLSMGSTSASISTVLAAFFLGMALGSYFAERISRNRINSFKPYIILEIGIAVSGLLLLPILLNLDSFIASVPAIGSVLPGKFLITMLLLLVPTVCIGATFPVMASILIRKENEIGLRLGQLYALNTFGAIFGALLAGFAFIPTYGLDGAIYIAVALNATVAILALIFNKSITLPPINRCEKEQDKNEAPAKLNKEQKLALIILMGTGFASIASEIGWTKYLSIFTGTTIFGFAAILGIFLMGIAAGSWVIRKHVEKIQSPDKWLAFALVLAALLLIYSRVGMAVVPILYEAINSISISGAVKQWLKYFIVFLIIFPPTFVFGAIFPINIKLYCGNLSGVQARVGKAYAANTLASIAGSIVAGFWIIPTYGTNSLLTMMCCLVVILSLLFIFSNKTITYKTPLIASVAVVLIATFTLPQLDYKRLISSVTYKFDYEAGNGKEPEFLFIKEGKVSVISLVSYDGKIAKVQANGLNESMIDLNDPSNALVIESMLAYIPYVIHDDPKSAFVVGFGGGITTRAFTHTDIDSIRVVELEPTVVEAGKQILNGPVKALEDPRVNIEFNDARNTLLTEENTYDIIAAQPSHPWRAGASNVFTQEFFELVKSRLNEGGIFSQWINLFRMDVTTLKSLFKAFYTVFPEGTTFASLDTGDLMMVGSSQPISLNFDQITQRINSPEIAAMLRHHDISRASDLLWYFGLSREEALNASKDSVPNTDRNIFSEVRLSSLLDDPSDEENPYLFLLENFQFDIIPYLDPRKAKQQIQEASETFLKWNSPKLALKLAHQQFKLDEAWGRGLKHDIFHWRYDWQGATEWYNSHADWRPQTHIKQLKIHLINKEWQEAEKIIDNIPDKKWKRVGHAVTMYYKNEMEKLANLQPQSIEEKYWQLIGLAQTDILSAGESLEKLVKKNTLSEPHIHAMIHYYANKKDIKALETWSHQLANIQDKALERYSLLTDVAHEEENLGWNMALIEKIISMKADYVNLPRILQTRQNIIENSQ